MKNSKKPLCVKRGRRRGAARAYVELVKSLDAKYCIGTYDAYAEWLALAPQGSLYLKQAILALAYRLAKTGDRKQIRSAVEGTLSAAWLLMEKPSRHND